MPIINNNRDITFIKKGKRKKENGKKKIQDRRDQAGNCGGLPGDEMYTSAGFFKLKKCKMRES